MMEQQSFFQAFKHTLRQIFIDKGVVMLLVIAPLIYGVFYPWPYSTEAVRKVPVAVIDYDHSDLSRQIIRLAQASPSLSIQYAASEDEAKQLLWAQKIGGYMVIPAGLKHHVLHKQPATIALAANGSYMLLNKTVLTGLVEVVATVSAGIQIKQLTAAGLTQSQAYAAQNPIPLYMQAQYNSTQGYGSYVVPGVVLLILQQTLLMGTAMMVGTWQENNPQPTSMITWLGRIVAVSMVGWPLAVVYFGWIFFLQGYGRGENLPAAILLALIYVPAVATLGCVLGCVFKQRERALQIIMASSLPLFFLTGYTWFADQLPWLLRWARWLVPSTPGVLASVRFNQIGTPLTAAAWLLGVIMLQWIVYLCLLYLLNRRQMQSQHQSA